MILIIDYGLGNLYSIEKALKYAQILEKDESKIIITSDKNIIKNAKAIVLPGVGAFSSAMENLKQLDLIDALYDAVMIKKTLFLGICLGYQLLFEKSYEEKETFGLNFLKGEVKIFDKNCVKVPHIGWNNVNLEKADIIFENIKNSSYFYFVHSFFVNYENLNLKNANKFFTHYGKQKFLSGIHFENIFGFQFHPEKSQKNGITLLRNFLKIKKKSFTFG